jgi:RNA polymerase sigma factor (sigma-70 family)
MISVRATGERGERAARLVCAAFISAWRDIPGMMAAAIEAFQKAVPRLANETGLAEYLTGHLVTHTSVQINRRLRAGIDERREEGESLFARLLKELPAEALAVYVKRPQAWGDLMDLRSEVARQLEKQDTPPKETDLAAFADREKLLKYAQTWQLSPQELEVFRLYIENPTLKYREIADQLGISTSQVGVIKHRINKKRAASF